MTTRSASIRVGAFAAMELMWIIFAIVCLARVIPISNGFILRIKTVWTTFTVFYQVVATSPLIGVLAYTFSCEWNRRGIQRQSDQGNAVSTSTAGLVERGVYVLFKHATLPFVLAFIASLLVTVLSTIAPATVSINPIFVNKSADFTVGSFTGYTDAGGTEGAATFLSNAFVFLEHIQNVSYGFDMPPGTLFGMPSRDYLGQNMSWSYEVTYYNYTCTFSPPTYQVLAYQAGDLPRPWWQAEWVVDDIIFGIDVTVPGARPSLTDRTGFFYETSGYDISPLSGKVYSPSSI
ncbi:hypothetical protein HWV62_4605 [Athelia sp. TMB]|nr:hypothetical protein HWV62_4605 [Athelia sp. TMB]